MHKLYRLVLPSWQEVILYSFAGLVLLVGLNANALWQGLLASTHTDPETAQSITTGMKSLISRYTTLSDPQIVNSVVWGLTAGLGFLVAIALLGFVRAAEGDREGTRGYQMGFIERLGMRIVALAGLVILMIIMFGIVLPACSQVFVRSAIHLTATWYNGLELIGAVLAVGGCLYLAAILCRLVVLRLRVFSPVID